MPLTLLFPHFHDLIRTPADVQRLNEAILQLAVQGKLVPQDPDDEPASELLKRIEVEKKRLVEEKKIRKAKPLPPIKPQEVPYELPEGWAWVQIGEICDVRGGKRVPKGYGLQESPTTHIYVRVTDMKNGTIEDSNLRYISDEIYKQIKQYTISREDLYITIAGTIGKIGIVPEKFHLMNLTENAAKLGFHLLDRMYARIALSSAIVQAQFTEKVNQMAQPKLALIRIKTTLFPLPPLAEQKRIVAKVEELFAQTRALEAKLRQAQADIVVVNQAALHRLQSAGDNGQRQTAWATVADHFDLLYSDARNVAELRQTILQLAVQGKLAPQDPDDEPASELLKRIEAEKKQLVEEKKIRKAKPLPPIKSEEVPHDLPKGWKWIRFGQVSYVYRGHNPPKHEFVYEPQQGYVRFVQITDFKTDDKAVYVPISHRNKLVYEGEILMAAYRHIGKLSRSVEGAFNVALCKIMDVPPMSRDYLEKLIGTDYVKGELLKASGRSHIPSMHTKHLLSLIVPLPPLAEQKRIVAKVDQLMALCDTLEAKLGQEEAEGRVLVEAVLAGVGGESALH